jgi:hypothetical protein
MTDDYNHVLVMIEWTDSARYPDSDWMGDESEMNLITMKSFGVLVRETEDLIAIAQDFSPARPYTPYRGVMVIPIINIIKIKRYSSD